MEMKKINAGKLRAIDYSGVGEEVWRKLSTSGAAWSYYRDNIEEEFTGRRSTVRSQGKSQSRDALFKAFGDERDV